MGTSPKKQQNEAAKKKAAEELAKKKAKCTADDAEKQKVASAWDSFLAGMNLGPPQKKQKKDTDEDVESTALPHELCKTHTGASHEDDHFSRRGYYLHNSFHGKLHEMTMQGMADMSDKIRLNAVKGKKDVRHLEGNPGNPGSG